MARAKTKEAVDDTPHLNDTYAELSWRQIFPAEDNVREELGDVGELTTSINQVGLLQPLLVTPLGTEPDEFTGLQNYRIIAGHRRYQAVLQSTLDNDKIPCMIRLDVDDSTRVQTMVIENLQRNDLNPIEEAHAFERLGGFGWKQADIAKRIGRSPSYISSRLLLLKLPEEVIAQTAAGKLPLQTAEKLTQIKDPAVINALTRVGQQVPSDSAIRDALNAAKCADAIAAMTKAAEARDIEVTRDYLSRWQVKIVAEVADPSDLETLSAASIKKARLYVAAQPYNGTVQFTLARVLTEAERAKLDAAAAALRAEEMAERSANEAKREEIRLAQLSAEEQEWERLCTVARAEHAEALEQYHAEVAKLDASWAGQVDAKLVAKWAMLNAIEYAYSYDVAKILDLQKADDETWDEAIHTYCMQSGANLVKTTAVALASIEGDNLDEDNLGPVTEDLRRFVKKAKLVEPVLVLPPSPANPDGEEMTAEEADAIRQIQDEAAEASQDYAESVA